MGRTAKRQPRPCLCGCREVTKGGEFIPGHDMRHKSRLVAEVQAGNNPAAYEEMERRGWLGALNKAKGRSRPKPAVTAERNFQYSLDVLTMLKAAGRRLKLTDQYSRGAAHRIELTTVNMLAVIADELPELLPTNNGRFVDQLSAEEAKAYSRLCKSTF
jgi:hypothetical protein